jgi:hypothetical protein
MKVLTSGYKHLALLECGCCRDEHTLLLTKESDGDLDFTFDDVKDDFWWTLKQKILRAY